MATLNALVMVHGMTPELEPCSHFDDYEAFWQRLCARERELAVQIPVLIGVQWGHALPRLDEQQRATAARWGYQAPPDLVPLRPDELLTGAQRGIGTRVDVDTLRGYPGPNNILLSGWGDLGLPIVRAQVFYALREHIVLRGFGDAVYYCSTDGERQVREVVYGQILARLDALDHKGEVRLHLVGHSLGVTLIHDFLYGLFTKRANADFLLEGQGSEADQARFKRWSQRAAEGLLTVGTFVSAASQLPLFAMRKQAMVKIFAEGGFLDPGDIGIRGEDRTRWLIFYDIDDMLGFPTRPLYQPDSTIVEMQVDAGDSPVGAHTAYWENAIVVREAAALLAANSR